MTVLSPGRHYEAGIDPAPAENPWIGLRRQGRFFRDAEIDSLLDRALRYSRAGVCVHLAGTAGLGKTTLALRIAEELGRPVSFMTGNEWLTTRDFIGGEIGQTVTSVVDRYIQSVRRTESTARIDWKDSILTLSMLRGHTFIYDEFTRASPEANAALLSVLEEGVLVSTDHASRRSCIEAHPEFRVILTSNPHEYEGVNVAPDALVDRMVTLRLREPSEATLVGIVATRTGLDETEALRIVQLVRTVREATPSVAHSSVRACVLIGRIAAALIAAGRLTTIALAEIAADVLGGRGIEISPADIARILDATAGEEHRTHVRTTP